MNFTQLKIALGALKKNFYDTRLDTLGFYGKNVRLEYPISFHNPKNVFLEDNVIIKSDALVINTIGKLIMKKNSGAAQRFTVITGNHHPVKNTLFFDSVKNRLADIEKDVIVEEDVRIGANVTILCGVTIGRGAIIGAGTVIRKNIPRYSIVIGNPAKIVKFVFAPEEIVEHEQNLYPESERIPLAILQKNQDNYVGKIL